MYRIKKGDSVKVISGNYKGQMGRVLRLMYSNNRALVEGMNKVKKHMRPSQENPQGGIIEKEMSIHLSNLMKGSYSLTISMTSDKEFLECIDTGKHCFSAYSSIL